MVDPDLTDRQDRTLTRLTITTKYYINFKIGNRTQTCNLIIKVKKHLQTVLHYKLFLRQLPYIILLLSWLLIYIFQNKIVILLLIYILYNKIVILYISMRAMGTWVWTQLDPDPIINQLGKSWVIPKF